MEDVKIQRLGRLRYGPGSQMGSAALESVQSYAADIINCLEGQVRRATNSEVGSLLRPLFAEAAKMVDSRREKAVRAKLLDKHGVHIPPVPRRVGDIDGHEDLVYDLPFERTMQRALEYNPDFLADIMETSAGNESSIKVYVVGIGTRSHPHPISTR